MDDYEFNITESPIPSDESDSISLIHENVGEVVQIVDENFCLIPKNLKKVLEPLAETPVIPISFVGETKIGKSFLLNNCLRHLKNVDESVWFTDKDFTTSGGFESANTADSCTDGIWLWSEPLYVDGIQYPILLMDTQGTFGDNMDFKRSAAIFAFSALASSTIVYNVNGKINGNDVRNLDIFAKVAQMCNGDEKAFQKFIYLCRDWKFSKQYDFGFNGGFRHVNDFLQKDTEEKEAKQRILRAFGQPSGFLMPHPGEKVAEGEMRSITDVSGKFQTQLKVFLNGLFTKEYMKPMRVKGVVIDGEELISYIEAIVNLLSNTTEIAQLSLSEIHDTLAITDASKTYKETLSQFGNYDSNCYYQQHSTHSVFEAIRSYLQNPKRFSSDLKANVLDELETKVKDINVEERKKHEALIKGLAAETVNYYRGAMKTRLCESNITNESLLQAHNASLNVAFEHFFNEDAKGFEVLNEDICKLLELLSDAFSEHWEHFHKDTELKQQRSKNAFAEASKSELEVYRQYMGRLLETDDASTILEKHKEIVTTICEQYEHSIQNEQKEAITKKVRKMRKLLQHEYDKFCHQRESNARFNDFYKIQSLENESERRKDELEEKKLEISALKLKETNLQKSIEEKTSKISSLTSEIDFQNKMQNKVDKEIEDLKKQRAKDEKDMKDNIEKISRLETKTTMSDVIQSTTQKNLKYFEERCRNVEKDLTHFKTLASRFEERDKYRCKKTGMWHKP